jgi:hypothetical protein
LLNCSVVLRISVHIETMRLLRNLRHEMVKSYIIFYIILL